MVEAAAPEVEALAAEEAQPGRVARDAEGVGVGGVVVGALEDGRRHHEDLVRERADRREQARAADDDAVVVLVDDARSEGLVALLGRADGAVRLREDQRVRQEQVVLAHVLVVAADVLGERGVGLAEPVGGARHRHDRARAVVARAPEVPERVLGPDAHRLAPAHDVVDALRLEERHADAVAGRRRLVGHHVAERRVVLQVEELRVRPDDAAELGDLRDAAGVLLPLDLDVDRALVQRLDVLPARSGSHRRSFPSRRGTRRPARAPRASRSGSRSTRARLRPGSRSRRPRRRRACGRRRRTCARDGTRRSRARPRASARRLPAAQCTRSGWGSPEKCRATASCSAPSTLTAKGASPSSLCPLACLPIETSTSGGSSETAVKALTVRPCGPSSPATVTTQTPVPNRPRAPRSRRTSSPAPAARSGPPHSRSRVAGRMRPRD